MRSRFLVFLSFSLVLASVRPGTAAAAGMINAAVNARTVPVASGGIPVAPLALPSLTAGSLLSAPTLTGSLIPALSLPELPALAPTRMPGAPLHASAAPVNRAVGVKMPASFGSVKTSPAPSKKESGPMGLKTLLRRSPELRLEAGAAESMTAGDARSAGAGIMDKILGWKTGGHAPLVNRADERHADPFVPLVGRENVVLSKAAASERGRGAKTPSPIELGLPTGKKFGKVNAMGQFYTAAVQAAIAAGAYFSAGLAVGMPGWMTYLPIGLYSVSGLLGVSAAGFIALGFRIALSRAATEESGVHEPLTPPYTFYKFQDIRRILTSPLSEGPLTYISKHAARPLVFHTRLRKKVSWFGAYALQGASHFRYLAVEAVTGVKTLLSLGSLVLDMYRGNPEAADIVKKQRKGMFTLQGINVTQAMIGVGTSYLVGSLVDTALAKEAAFAVMLAAGVVAVSLFNSYLQTVYSWVKSRLRTSVIRDFRLKLFGHVVKLPFSFFAREKPSEIAVRLNTDVAQIAVKNVDIPAVLPYYGAMAVLSGVMMFITSWQVTLFVMATMPLLGFMSAVYGNKAEKLNEAQMTRQARMISTAEESLSNIRDVRGFTAEDIEKARYEKQAELFAGTILKKARLSGAYTEVMGQVYNFSFYLAVLFIGLFSFIANGAPTIGETMALVGYAGYMKLALSGFISLYTQYRETTGSARRVFNYLAETPAVADSEKAVEPGRLAGNIVFDSVSFSHAGQDRGLRAVSFEVGAGQHVSIVGKESSGKSLLLDLLMRLQDPSSGAVKFDEADIRGFKIRGLRDQIAMLHDRGIWIEEDTVRENLTYGLGRAVTDEQIAEALRAVDAGFILDENRFPEGLDSRVARADWRMSEGRRRHLEIARALLADPSLLLLDSPSAGLSDYEARRLKRSLEKLEEGRTVVSVPQSISDAETADLILVMDNGVLVERGTHEELMALDGVYAGLSRREAASR